MQENILFEEKQYLGSNKQSIFRRLLLSIFCFVAYYWSENPKPVDVSGIHIGSYPINDIPNSGELFFIMGMVILVLSAAMIFVLHIKTTVTPTNIVLDGLWTSKKVKIVLDTIVKAEKVDYSKYSLNRPAYNLHHRGTITFFTSGKKAIELTDKDGLHYRIGTQRPDELLMAIAPYIKQG